MKTEAQVVAGVKSWTKWWIDQREQKLTEELSDTMSTNPFMIAAIYDYHCSANFEDLIRLLVNSHLMTGHHTGFGKLIDEKILPEVFGTDKLTRQYRAQNAPLNRSHFDEIDHIVTVGGRKTLLSLKAGKWTIQLTMAVQLNAALHNIITDYPDICDDIVVGVYYGNSAGLTDKYRIIRGINTGANHDVHNIMHRVEVFAGKDFWGWLNEGEVETQDWVLKGIIEATQMTNIRTKNSALLQAYTRKIAAQYSDCMNADGTIDWMKMLNKINS